MPKLPQFFFLPFLYISYIKKGMTPQEFKSLAPEVGLELKQAGPGLGGEAPDRGPLGMGYAPPPGPAAPSSGGSGTKQAPVDQVPLWLLIKPI